MFFINFYCRLLQFMSVVITICLIATYILVRLFTFTVNDLRYCKLMNSSFVCTEQCRLPMFKNTPYCPKLVKCAVEQPLSKLPYWVMPTVLRKYQLASSFLAILQYTDSQLVFLESESLRRF